MLNCLLKAAGVISLCLFISGCSTIGFYAQSIGGHTRLMLDRIPLTKAIEQVQEPQRAQLQQVAAILEFAQNEIELPTNGSYESFVPLKRDYPVYVVSAAPEFSLDPVQWCYLVVGCASYRGYFDEAQARAFAEGLQADAKVDVYVRGVAAYSTLGWFDDPVLPSMLHYGDIYLAELLFHELTHQRIYLDDSTDFNEALASAIAEHATLKWLHSKGDRQALERYKVTLRLREDFDELLASYKLILAKFFATLNVDALSSSDLDRARILKTEIHTEFVENYQRLKSERWDGDARYDDWIEASNNMARIAAFSAYRSHVKEFETLIGVCAGDMAAFFQLLEALPSAVANDEYGNRAENGSRPTKIPKTCSE